MNIIQLVQSCESLLYASGYTPERINLHDSFWKKELIPFMSDQGCQFYSPEVGEKYLEMQCKGLSRSIVVSKTLGLSILNFYLEFGKLPRYIASLPTYPLMGEIGNVAQRFLDEAFAQKHLRDLTVSRMRRDLNLFLTLLSVRGKTTLVEITETDIVEFLSKTVTSRNNRFYTLHHFLSFLYREKMIAVDYSHLTEYRKPTAERLVSTYTAEEVATVESSISRHSAVGKRDYAIVLLASRLGLRSSDIGLLKLSQINWEDNCIDIVQYKTGQPLRLPLLTVIGEALVDYLRVRPIVSIDNVFTTVTSPYRELNNMSINGIVGRCFNKAGINTKKKHKGPHALRHSLATSMLNNGASLPVISATLGHKDTTTTMMYLRVDLKQLSECTLNVPMVDEDFFEQKGGVFYV